MRSWIFDVAYDHEIIIWNLHIKQRICPMISFCSNTFLFTFSTLGIVFVRVVLDIWGLQAFILFCEYLFRA